MTDPLNKLKQWREITEAATPGEMYHGGPVAKQFTYTSRTAMPALLTAVQNVLKEHEESWSCGNPRHTNPEVGCPDCWVECGTCGCTYPCVTVMAIRDAIGGAE